MSGMLVLFAAVVSLIFVCCSASGIRVLNVQEGDEAQQLAQWALGELQKLSDSGIYSTLSLQQLYSAEEEEGIFHMNTILELSLASPHFKSGKPAENFTIVVMKHHEEPYRTLAIDEFPEMDEDAIEQFYIRKVERKRQEREEVLSQWEQEVQRN